MKFANKLSSNVPAARLLSAAQARPTLVRNAFVLVIAAGVLAMAVGAHRHESKSSQASATAKPTQRFDAKSASRPGERTRQLAPEYRILLQRSLFSIGADSSSSAATASASNGSASAAFALKGISQEDASFTAFVEDTNARRVIAVHPGDIVGTGQIHDMNLHALNYQIGGKMVRVEIGQGLDGKTFVASAAAPDSVPLIDKKHKHATPGSDRASMLDDGQ